MDKTYDFVIQGTIHAETEDEARRLVQMRLSFGPKGMAEPVYLDTHDIDLWEVE
jgi:hypothetical protein